MATQTEGMVLYQAEGGQPIFVKPGQTEMAEQVLAAIGEAGATRDLMAGIEIARPAMRMPVHGGACELKDGSAVEFVGRRQGHWQVVRLA